MDASDFFATVVTQNYHEAKADPANFRKTVERVGIDE
jgi:hypothetical protein